MGRSEWAILEKHLDSKGSQNHWRFPRFPRAPGEAHGPGRAEAAGRLEADCPRVPVSLQHLLDLVLLLAGTFCLCLLLTCPMGQALFMEGEAHLSSGVESSAASRCWRHEAAVLTPACSAWYPTPSPSCPTPASAPDCFHVPSSGRLAWLGPCCFCNASLSHCPACELLEGRCPGPGVALGAENVLSAC